MDISAERNNTIEPLNERCCAEDADVRTESSDCTSCRSESIPEVKVERNDCPIIVTQCIWNPIEESEASSLLSIPDLKPTLKPKLVTPKKKPVPQAEPYDYNLPPLSDYVMLPLYDLNISALTFGEILLISFLTETSLKCSADLFNFKCENYATIGGFCINIQRDGHNIIVYSSSEFSCNGKTTRGSIYCLCDSSLNLIEEKRCEAYIDENGDKKEKSIHLIQESITTTSEEKRLVAFRTENDNRMISKFYSKIKLNVTGALLPDGLNFVLIRHLVIIRYLGKFETWTINIDGHICRSVYNFKPIRSIKINSTLTEVAPVERFVINVTSTNDKPQIIKMFYLRTGHMVRHAWNEYPFIIHINPFASIPPSGFILNSFETWQKHIELVSFYLDYKDNAQSRHKTYLDDKPEARCMIKDYINLLLEMKPANILGLTVEYFMNLHGDVQNVAEEENLDSDSDSELNSNLDSSSGDDEEQYDEHDEKSLD